MFLSYWKQIRLFSSLLFSDGGGDAANSSPFFGLKLKLFACLQCTVTPLGHGATPPHPQACHLMPKRHLCKTTAKASVVFLHHLSGRCHISLVLNVFMPTAASCSHTARLPMNHAAGGRSAPLPSSSPSSLLPFPHHAPAPPLSPPKFHRVEHSASAPDFSRGLIALKLDSLQSAPLPEQWHGRGLAWHLSQAEGDIFPVFKSVFFFFIEINSWDWRRRGQLSDRGD